ncbi:MAG: aminotransferase class III-fold pyridoxal phosphate-dependent enzyme, partial [Proteobacteria bacterium]
GLGGAVFPMAAILARSDLDRVPELALGHYTHEKSPVGCAAALATLDTIEREDLMTRARTLGATALARMKDMEQRYGIVREARGLGLHLGIELANASGPATDAAERVLYHSLENGLSYKLGAGCVITLCPPLTISDTEMTRALDIVEQGIAAVDG